MDQPVQQDQAQQEHQNEQEHLRTICNRRRRPTQIINSVILVPYETGEDDPPKSSISETLGPYATVCFSEEEVAGLPWNIIINSVITALHLDTQNHPRRKESRRNFLLGAGHQFQQIQSSTYDIKNKTEVQ
jgi:hypothetical protein